MNRFLIVIIAICLNLSSCQTETRYRNTLNELIPEDLHKHLPTEINTDIFSIYFNLKPENGKYVAEPTLVYISYISDQFDSIKTHLEEMKIEPFKFNDDCNMVILKFQRNAVSSVYQGKEWLYNKWVKDLNECDSLNGPIPNFSDIGDEKLKYGISKNFNLFVIEAKSGIYFNEKYYEGEHILPSDWEHGYSKGVALNSNSKEVIHWLIIW
jgi:hypothetical protein